VVDDVVVEVRSRDVVKITRERKTKKTKAVYLIFSGTLMIRLMILVLIVCG
jgi:hypothetical protein